MLRGALIGVAAALLEALRSREQEPPLRGVIERFKLDPVNPADAAAALTPTLFRGRATRFTQRIAGG